MCYDYVHTNVIVGLLLVTPTSKGERCLEQNNRSCCCKIVVHGHQVVVQACDQSRCRQISFCT